MPQPPFVDVLAKLSGSDDAPPLLMNTSFSTGPTGFISSIPARQYPAKRQTRHRLTKSLADFLPFANFESEPEL
jgi:hypothetical protein